MLKKVKQVKQLFYGYDSPPPTLKILYNGEQIAELKLENGRYTFRYLDAFRRLALQPLPGLSPDDPPYEGRELPLPGADAGCATTGREAPDATIRDPREQQPVVCWQLLADIPLRTRLSSSCRLRDGQL